MLSQMTPEEDLQNALLGVVLGAAGPSEGVFGQGSASSPDTVQEYFPTAHLS